MNQPTLWRRFTGPTLIGLVGVIALLAMPLPPAVLEAGSPLSAASLRFLVLLNPAILVLMAGSAGALLAHPLGLRSLAAGTVANQGAWRLMAWAALSGVGLGLLLGAADGWVIQHADGAILKALHDQQTWQTRLAGMVYGGLAEEVMLRWGLMSLLAWGLSKTVLRHRSSLALGLALLITAGLFAAAHLPALAAQTELNALLVWRTLALNGVAGVIYGLWFWRAHLEAAMTAHAATHVGLWLGSYFLRFV